MVAFMPFLVLVGLTPDPPGAGTPLTSRDLVFFLDRTHLRTVMSRSAAAQGFKPGDPG